MSFWSTEWYYFKTNPDTKWFWTITLSLTFGVGVGVVIWFLNQ